MRVEGRRGDPSRNEDRSRLLSYVGGGRHALDTDITHGSARVPRHTLRRWVGLTVATLLWLYLALGVAWPDGVQPWVIEVLT